MDQPAAATARTAPASAASGRTAGIGPLEDSRTWLLAGIGGLVAGGIHFAIAPDHFAEAAGQGLFFAMLGTVQVGWAMWHLGRPSLKAWWIGISIAFTSILTWILSLVIVAPFVADTETVDYLAVFTKLIEVTTIVLLAVPLVQHASALGRARPKAIVTVLVALGIGLAGTGAAYGAGYGLEIAVPDLGEPSEHHHGADEHNATSPGALTDPIGDAMDHFAER